MLWTYNRGRYFKIPKLTKNINIENYIKFLSLKNERIYPVKMMQIGDIHGIWIQSYESSSSKYAAIQILHEVKHNTIEMVTYDMNYKKLTPQYYRLFSKEKFQKFAGKKEAWFFNYKIMDWNKFEENLKIYCISIL